MNVGSLFSGIGGLDHGLARAGFRHQFFCESDAWRRSVLAQHWPGVPIYDDVHKVAVRRGKRPEPGVMGRDDDRGDGRREWSWPEDENDRLDLLCGGFPCQDLSVAGKRAGLAGARSGLFHEFARIIDAVRPRWVLVENVPGLLSSNGGRDFGVVLGTLADLGYGLAWRVLDSRYFGVPQRRRRVFIVGAESVGDPRAAAERAGQVLAVGTRCDRHPPKGGEAGAGVAGALAGRSASRLDDACVGGGQLVSHALTSAGHDASEDGTGRGTPLIDAPLSHGSNPNSNMAGRRREDDVNLVPYTFDWQMGGSWSGGTPSRSWIQDTPGRTRSLVKNKTLAVHAGTSVRRLTPRECERLQGLPDDWTAYGPDSRRYAGLGDAVTSPVGYYIGTRIRMAA